MKITNQILRITFLTLIILISTFTLSSCKSFFIRDIFIEKEVNKILKDDLNTRVKILRLYYNEEENGYFVKFETISYIDKAAINLDTGVIVYEREFDNWSAKAEYLRNQKPINEYELHKYNQKILDSAFYAEWNFAISLFEADGRPEDSEWKRIK